MSIFDTLLNNSPGELSHTSPTSDQYTVTGAPFSTIGIAATMSGTTYQLSNALMGLSNSAICGSIDTSCINSTPYYSNLYNGTFLSNMRSVPELNQLESMSYIVDFELDDDKTLSKSLCEITEKTFIFDCKMDGNRIQPYEKLMKLINEETKMNVKVEISDVLTLRYKNLQFSNIENNFKFNNGYCSLSKLKVNFKFEKVLYENEKLSIKEKRSDKLNNILKNNE